MTPANLKAIANKMGWELDKWIRIPNLQFINLISDGNNMCVPHKEEFWIDSAGFIRSRRYWKHLDDPNRGEPISPHGWDITLDATMISGFTFIRKVVEFDDESTSK